MPLEEPAAEPPGSALRTPRWFRYNTAPVVAAANRSPRRPWHPWAFFGIIFVAVVLRFHDLSAQSFWLDELWGLETAAGHGADHLALTTGRPLVPVPDLTHLSAARPIWTLWTGMDRVTHPPGSYLLLRVWMDLFGQSEAAVRSLSAVTSTLAMLMLFLAVQPWAGPEPALWAAALMAVAGPQVHAAQDARVYAPLTLLGTVALWSVGRTVRLGATWRRCVGLTAILLALLLTHYFAVAAMAAVGLYGLCFTHGAIRRNLVTAAVVAGLISAIAWVPFLARQTAAMSRTDRAAAFLNDPDPGHVTKTLARVLALPASLLVDARPIPAAYGVVGALVYAGALVISRRRWPAVWPMWFLATVALLAGLDLARTTRHLNYIRYPLIAAPAAYVAIALLPTVHRIVGRLLAAAAVAFAVWSLPQANVPPNDDFRALAAAVTASVPPGDPIIFAGPSWRYGPQILYLAVSHYAGPPTGPVMLLEHPASAWQMSLFHNPKVVWMVAHPDIAFAPNWLPGCTATVGQTVPHVGVLMRMERK